MLHSTPHRRVRRGAVAVWVAVSMPVLIAVVALSIDAGLLFDLKRQTRGGADAAALAAAGDLFQTYSNAFLADDGQDLNGAAKAHALAVAASNGYTNDGTTSIVTVNIPPKSGLFVNEPGYVEVIIEYRQKRGFSAIFGGGDLPVRSRAVARGRWSPMGIGILCLDPTSPASLSVQGQCTGIVPQSAVIVNSSAPDAADGGGQGGTLTAKSFEITGGYDESGGQQFIGPIKTGVPPTPDPYRDLPEPDPATMPKYRYPQDATKVTLPDGTTQNVLQPGVYVGGIKEAGQTSLKLLPGIYYMQGGGFEFSGTGTATLTATEVMLFNGTGTQGGSGQAGNIKISGNAAITWTPPSTGVYRGLSFFQARGIDLPISIIGNGGMNIKGAWYARDAMINVGGNGVNYVGNQFICWNMKLYGSGTYIVPWVPGTIQPVRDLKLVE